MKDVFWVVLTCIALGISAKGYGFMPSDTSKVRVSLGELYNYTVPVFHIEGPIGSAVEVSVCGVDGAGIISRLGIIGASGGSDIVLTQVEDEDKPALALGNDYIYTVSVDGKIVAKDVFSTEGRQVVFSAMMNEGKWMNGEAEWERSLVIDADRPVAVVEQQIRFAEAIDVEDLEDEAMPDSAYAAFALAEDENGLVWKAYVKRSGASGYEWSSLYGVEPELNRTYTLRTTRLKDGGHIAYSLEGRLLEDEEHRSIFAFAEKDAPVAIDCRGEGVPAEVRGISSGMAIARVGGRDFATLEDALADDGYRAGADSVELLTSVLWSPQVGEYRITKGTHEVRIVNEKVAYWNSDGTQVSVGIADAPIASFGLQDESGERRPLRIDAEWLNVLGTEGKTRREIEAMLNARPVGARLTPAQAYLLGFAAREVEKADLKLVSPQNADPGKISFALARAPRMDAGVAVRLSVLGSDSADGKVFEELGVESTKGMVEVDLPREKVRFYRFKVRFE